MRRRVIACLCVSTTALLASAVWGKEEPGSRATFGQRISSLFGLIDKGDDAPPPPPPGMPPMSGRRPSHSAGHGQNFAVPDADAGATTHGSIPHGGEPSPPEPQRDDEQAVMTSDEADPSQSIEQPPRPSMVMQSRRSTPPRQAAPRTAAGLASGQTRSPYVRSPSAAAPPQTALPSSAALRTSAAPVVTAPPATSPAAATVPQAIPMSQPAAAAAPQPVVSSRRRAQSPGVSSGGVAEAAKSFETPSAAPSSAPGAAAAASAGPVMVPMDVRTTNVTPQALSSDAEVSGRPLPAANTAAAIGNVSPNPEPVVPLMKPAAALPIIAAPQPSGFGSASPIPAAPTAASSNLLAAFNSPELTVEATGPRRIAVGRTAEYRLVVRNRGTAEAHDVVVSPAVPEWAEVAGFAGNMGHDETPAERAAGEPLRWKIESLPGRAQAELTLTLVPRRNQAFELGVHWSCSPATAVAAIEVEEPQLQMAISGPSEVTYGEQRLYKLTVSNPGNGTAENVVLQLMPLSAADGEAVSHTIGNLKAGESTSIEVELTARQAGQLKIRASASAAGNLKAEASTDVVVRRAALELAAMAPRILFAGVPGTYEIRVRNTGDDQAKNVRLSLELPHGAKLLSAAPPIKGDGKSGPPVWVFDRIAAGAEQVCTLQCLFEQGGVQQITAAVVADGDLRKSARTATDVQAVADLALDVVDTAGPVAVGRPVTYEVHVKNRGMKSAEGVEVVAYFSEGIEPEKAEGQGYELQPGMVVFKPLAAVGAGQDKVLRITARASTPGNHRLRVELRGTNPPTQLSHEDSTLFYSDEAASQTGPTSSPPADFVPPPSAGPVRPAAATAPAAATTYPPGASPYRSDAKPGMVMPYLAPGGGAR